MSIVELNGDLLSNPGYIVHQVNATTHTAKGLSKLVFDKYPSANVYADGTVRIPGTIIVRGHVINLVGQNKPGKPTATETAQQREVWFWESLTTLGQMMNRYGISVVAMPYGIGCGLAGGDWNRYVYMIQMFAQQYHVTVRIYKL